MAGETWQKDRAGSLIDDIPASYKDIDQVMADQTDLVRVDHTLHRVLNFKAHDGLPSGGSRDGLERG